MNSQLVGPNSEADTGARLHIGNFLAVLQSKARLALRNLIRLNPGTSGGGN
jgi:hypothetical protein